MVEYFDELFGTEKVSDEEYWKDEEWLELNESTSINKQYLAKLGGHEELKEVPVTL